MSTSALQPDLANRSLSDLLRDLSDGTTQLIRQEIQLARTETVESLHQLSGGVMQVAIGLVLATCAAGAAVACLILVLSQYVLGGTTWLSALLVSLGLSVIALICTLRGTRALAPSNLVPQETTTSIQETASWLKHPTNFDANSR